LTQDRTEGVEPETAVPAEEADANPVAEGTEAAAGFDTGAADAAEATTGEAATGEEPTEGEAADWATDAGESEALGAVSDDQAAEAAENAETADSGRSDGEDASADAAAGDDAPSEDDEAASDDAAAAGEAPTADEDALAAAVSDDDSASTETADADAVSDDDTAHAPAAVEEEEPEPEPAPFVDTRPEPTTMEELLAEQSTDIRSLKHGDVVEGNVVRIDKDEILVDIGAKSEGVVSNRELYGRNAESQPQLNIGDTVLVYVLQPESNEGHAVLSLRRAGLERKWRSMQEQLDAGVIIEAPVIDHNKGGLIVDCGIRGFVPISQIVDFPRRPQNEQPRDAAQEIAEKLQPYVGRKLRLKILEVNRKANRLILSEKVALYEERREKRDELFSSLKVGQQVKGTVRSIAPFGVFVDLGGIDGLVHKSELSWNKVNNPEAGYRVGEEVEAEVIDINHERGRISLSIRRLQPDPWHSTVADLKVNDVIEGTVTKIVNFGAFVRVREGLEGLIHISELSQQRVAHPGDVVHEGQKLNLKVISLDSERHRLGLSLKQAEENAPARPAVTDGAPVGAVASTSAPRERTERRGGRSERSGYDASQAVQEPEGGIDNTLAAAFAQVRQQMAEQENAATDGSEADEADEAGAASATAEEPEAVVADATEEPDAAEAPESAEATDTPAEATAAAEPEETEAGGDDQAESEAADGDEPTTDTDEPATEAAEATTEAAEATADEESTFDEESAFDAAEPDLAAEPADAVTDAAESISAPEAVSSDESSEESTDESSSDEDTTPESTDEASTDESPAFEESEASSTEADEDKPAG
jgi:small subunit ribosomal protein S1